MQIKVVYQDDKDLMALINELDEELLTRYPKEEIFALDFKQPKINTATFVVAYSGNMPVGCGALLPMCRECVELKRFFVRKAHRRKGIASGILLLLESEAKKQGYSIIKLETGPNQPGSLTSPMVYGQTAYTTKTLYALDKIIKINRIKRQDILYRRELWI